MTHPGLFCAVFVLYYSILSLGSSNLTAFNESNFVLYNEPSSRTDYSVVIDAGMMSSAITAFAFESIAGQSLKTHTLHYQTVSPGLVSCGKNPHKCVLLIHELVTKVRDLIPIEMWRHTPLQMIVTPNILLLPENQSNLVLDAIRDYFTTTEFKVDDDSVAVMNNRKKLDSWLTVNLLLGRLEDGSSNGTVALLDLGNEGSFMAFAPEPEDWMAMWQWELLSKLFAFGQYFRVFGYNHFGLGVNEARRQILEVGRVDDSNLFKSHCVHPAIKTTWKYAGKEYIVRGMGDLNGSYYDNKNNMKVRKMDVTYCVYAVKSVVAKYKKLPSLEGKEIYATSYFYAGAVKAGLFKVGENARATPSNFITNAHKLCQSPDFNNPFKCMDLVYLGVLLRQMYGLKEDSKVNLVLLLKGKEVSWPLGAAFEKYQNDITVII